MQFTATPPEKAGITLLLDRFSTEGNGHNSALVKEPQTGKNVSYSLGEAHLSGGVRACGTVVLKRKQGLRSKFFRPDFHFGAPKKT